MRGDVLWPLLLGSALTLVTTLVAQWSSLAYQTKRQREMRRADFQRTTLLQLRDTVAELDDAMLALMHVRREAQAREGGWNARFDYANWEAIFRLRGKLLIVGTGVDRNLYWWVTELALSTKLVSEATSEEEDRHQKDLSSSRRKVLWMLAERLARLP
jgi:hypothetical protein